MTAELVRRLLPALMSVGAGLGVALHTVLATWGSTISMGAVPSLQVSAAHRLIGEVVQSRRRPLLGPSPG